MSSTDEVDIADPNGILSHPPDATHHNTTQHHTTTPQNNMHAHPLQFCTLSPQRKQPRRHRLSAAAAIPPAACLFPSHKPSRSSIDTGLHRKTRLLVRRVVVISMCMLRGRTRHLPSHHHTRRRPPRLPHPTPPRSSRPDCCSHPFHTAT